MNNSATQTDVTMDLVTATRLLSTPGLRLTNTERKRLRRAREHVAPSRSPILGDKKRGYRYDEEPAPATPIARKMMAKTFKQLANLANRLPRLRKKLVRIRFKTSKADVRAMLTARISRIEFLAPFVETEMSRRHIRVPDDLLDLTLAPAND